jgi:RNA polymerase sigma factor (sigma-70 family)
MASGPEEESVSEWLFGVKQGDEAALQKLWERYFADLVQLARGLLARRTRRSVDEDDVAARAFEQFALGAQAGRFPRLNDRRDLWQVLVLLTRRRAIDANRRAAVRQRHEVGESGLPASLDQLPAASDLAEQFTEEVCLRLRELPVDLRTVALLKMEGHSNEEIARRICRVVRSVERKLERIRGLWKPRPPQCS